MARHVRRRFTVENTWVCTSCQAKNRGRDMKCTTCGSTKEKGERDKVPDPNVEKVQEVTDPELLKLAKQASNWVCSFCESQVRDQYGNCRNCGGGKGESAGRVVEKPKPAPTYKKPLPGPEPESLYSREEKNLISNLVWALIGIVGVAIVIGLLIFIFTPRELDAKVTGIQWDYTSKLFQRTLMHDTGWGHRGDAFNVKCETKLYGYEKCNPYDCNPHQVGYDCNPHDCDPYDESYSCNPHDCSCSVSCTDNGNGFSDCEESCDTCYDTCYRTKYRTCYDTCYKTEYDTCWRECPVYKDWCSYDWYDWPLADTKSTTGSSHDVVWPPLEARPVDQRLEKTEQYKVTFSDAVDSWTYGPSNLDEFKKFNTGASWRIKVTRIGTVTPLNEVRQ